MRRALWTTVPLLALAAAGAALVAQRDLSGVEVRVHPVAGKVSWIEGAGGNVGVSVGEDGVLLVDDQFEALAPRIEEAVVELAGAKPVFLVNTHWHGDHTGGNPYFGAHATIVAHENVRRRLARDPTIGGRTPEEVREAGLPVVTYEDGVSIHFNGERVRLVHVPAAHTDGDTVVWFTGSGVVHVGDLYFQLGYPFIDLESGGSVEGYLAGLDGVLEWIPADARVVPGHGEPTGVEELRAYRDMIAAVVGRVREGLAAGKGAEEMLAAGVTADFDGRWGNFSFVPPRRFVETIVADLGG